MTARKSTVKTLFIVLGDQLFDETHLPPAASDTLYFMAEDVELCTRYRYHKHKLILFLAAMRQHAEALRKAGYNVVYHELPEAAASRATSYESKVAAALVDYKNIKLVQTFAVNDKFLLGRLRLFCKQHKLGFEMRPSPMFVTPPVVFARYLETSKKPFMKTFYEQQRRRLAILVDADGEPAGGRWSFDADNRQRLPKGHPVPDMPEAKPHRTVAVVQALVERRFPSHPGASADFWLPTDRAGALAWLKAFLHERLADFGPYEDALSARTPCLFHSVLTPLLNCGLLTPDEVVRAALRRAKADPDIPLASLEGFVRQVIGWREFIRGIYVHYSERQETHNYFGHTRLLAPCWWDASTGLPPLDRAIKKATDYGYAHHIERLMVLANTMLLCEVAPAAAHAWFMEMFVDSADWVMGPNVYGMGIFSDGGIFATKPYICSSNYWLKMGEDKRGDWQDAIDGLYWRFVAKHHEKLQRNARLGPLTAAYARLPDARKKRLAASAEAFLAKVTVEPSS